MLLILQQIKISHGNRGGHQQSHGKESNIHGCG